SRGGWRRSGRSGRRTALPEASSRPLRMPWISSELISLSRWRNWRRSSSSGVWFEGMGPRYRCGVITELPCDYAADGSGEALLDQHAPALGDDVGLARAAGDTAPALRDEPAAMDGEAEPSVHPGVRDPQGVHLLHDQQLCRDGPEADRVERPGAFGDQVCEVGVPGREPALLGGAD